MLTAFIHAPALRKKRHLRISFGLEQPENQGLTLDLSETGAFIRTRHIFNPGLKLRVLMETPMGNMALEGRVVWVCDEHNPPRSPHEPGIGVQWIATDDQYMDIFNMI